MKDTKRVKELFIFFFVFIITLCSAKTGLADNIWFVSNEPHKINDGSVSQNLNLLSGNPLSRNIIGNTTVFAQEVPSKWNKKYHKGIFCLEKSIDKKGSQAYVINSKHSIRYEVKAITNRIISKEEKKVMSAKINLFLYGKMDFKSLENDHQFIKDQKFDFPLEIIDEKASSNYWLQAGQDINIQLLFFGKHLPEKTIKLFINDTFYEEFKTDAESRLVLKLPFPEEGVFRHSKDVCHYRLDTQHKYENTTYITTLTMLVHPARNNDRLLVGLCVLIGTICIAASFVFVKRAKNRNQIV